MKAAKVNINKAHFKHFMGFLHGSICPPYVEIKKLWNTSLVPIQWAKPHDATKMPQLLCVKLEDQKKITSQAPRRSRAVIHLDLAAGRGAERRVGPRRAAEQGGRSGHGLSRIYQPLYSFCYRSVASC